MKTLFYIEDKSESPKMWLNNKPVKMFLALDGVLYDPAPTTKRFVDPETKIIKNVTCNYYQDDFIEGLTIIRSVIITINN